MTGSPLKVDYAELERFAAEHDLNAAELIQWATSDPAFPERYLATHGKINFGTYLKIREFMLSKVAAGTAFAERNEQTAAALRSTIAMLSGSDEANAAAMKGLTVDGGTVSA